MSEIEQADRDSADLLIRKLQYPTEYLEEICTGDYDENYFIQAFARHRIAATAALQAENAELVLLLRMVAGCNYSVCTSIDARGYSWCEAYLDQVKPDIDAKLKEMGHE